jgi:hypothetical protein
MVLILLKTTCTRAVARHLPEDQSYGIQWRELLLSMGASRAKARVIQSRGVV